MMKRIIILSLTLVLLLSTSVFSYRWVQNGDSWSVVDEQDGEFLSNILLDTGDNVYYIGSDSKIVVGWWRNDKSDKYYFFDNKKDRNLGGMLFGLKMVDGYYRYFNDDGSLARSDKAGEYKKVYQDYYADINGNLYHNNVLLRDTTIGRSEYYSNIAYYENINLNNYYLANYDTVPTIESMSESSTTNSTKNGSSKAKTESNTAGGTNYYVDTYGHITTYGDIFETSEAEKYGPAKRD